MYNNEQKPIGQVTAADSEHGVTVHLSLGISVETLRQGQFVVIKGNDVQFFGTISGFKLAATNIGVAIDPPANGSALVRDTLMRGTTYAECMVQPSLELSADSSSGLLPARTIPSHFSSVALAGARDFATVFGNEQQGDHFTIGSPRDMEGLPITLNLKRFVERSNGIFGRSGTGKSMLARLLLCGVIKERACANLIFDMHTEYGFSKETEQSGVFVKGLQELFGRNVLVYTLDAESSRRKSRRYDEQVHIPFSYLTTDDLLSLEQELNLNETAASTAYLLHHRWGEKWIDKLMTRDPGAIDEVAAEVGANKASLGALWRKLQQLRQFAFITDSDDDAAIKRLLNVLKQGYNVVLEFGRYHSTLAYMLVATVLTRRIHEEWVAQTDKYEGTQNAADKPRPLMITIEEAHKFLTGKSGIFSTIAREMRKYFVTLMVIDQRPSSIDSDVLSQLGTRITALLSDERDIDAVFTGVGGGSHLKQTLATLDTRQEVLVFGHAVPMEVVLRTRNFDVEFYKYLQTSTKNAAKERDPRAAITRTGNGSSAHLESDDDGPDAWG